MAQRHSSPDPFAQELGHAIRQLAAARRAAGLRRGLSLRAFAAEAGIDGNRLWQAVHGKGRTLTAAEKAQALATLEEILARTVTLAPPGHPTQEILAAVVDLPRLSARAGLATDPVKDAAAPPAMDPAAPSATGWDAFFAQGEALSQRFDRRGAVQAYRHAATAARAAGNRPAAALSLARQMDMLIGLNAYYETLSLVDPILDLLGVPDCRPEGTWSVASFESQLLGGDQGLEVYSTMASLAAYGWHCLDQFPLAHASGQTAVRAAQFGYGGGYDRRLANAYHFLAKTLLEEAAVAEPAIGEGVWGLWRRPDTASGGWRWRVHQALTYLAKERAVRPPEDVIGHAHSWRNQMRVLSVLAEAEPGYGPRVTAALRQASFYSADALGGSSPSDPLIPLYIDQARHALRVGLDVKRIRTPAKDAAALASASGDGGHATWAWCIDAELRIRTQARGWEQKAKRSLLLSLAGWDQPVESRDSRRTVALARALGITAEDVTRFVAEDSTELDALAAFPGFERAQRLAAVLNRLWPPRLT